MRSYDMSEHWKLVSVDGGLVTGTVWVTRKHVRPVDVTVWDGPERHSGRIVYSDGFTAFIEDGKARIPDHMIHGLAEGDVRASLVNVEAACLAAWTTIYEKGVSA